MGVRDFDSLIFDLDGTLWDTCEACAVAWNNVIDRNEIKFRQVTASDVRSVTGKPHAECIKTIFSSLSNEEISILIDETMIEDIVAEPEKGVVYKGKVVKTVDFGAFVNFLGAKDGLVHISELQNERTEKTTDVCKENDEVYVKVIGFDDRGKVKLSMKRVDQETGNDLEKD